MNSAAKYKPHYTVEDYLLWKGDWELWNGIPVSMSPSPSFEHQRVATELVFLIKQQLREEATCRQCIVVGEFDWKIANDTVVRPDVLITCDSPPDQHLTLPPVFIAEVLSPSTASKDRTAKRALYELNGVAFYSVVDPKQQSTTVWKLESGSYMEVDTTGGPIELKLTDECSISVDFSRLFRGQ